MWSLVQNAAEACGTTGYVVSAISFATFSFLRLGDDPLVCLGETISAGGDTDSICATVGA
jgi:ADP-ribosylglycohydrolase